MDKLLRHSGGFYQIHHKVHRDSHEVHQAKLYTDSIEILVKPL